MHTKNVLHVEDELFDQMVLQNLIAEQNLPYIYHAAKSVKEAELLLHDNTFDLIILDYLLGDGTAMDLLRYAESTPTIILTAVTDTDFAVKAMKFGIYDYLIKDSRQKYLSLLPAAMINALRRKEVENRLRLKADFESIIGSISSFFVHLPGRDIDQGLQESLKKLCAFLGCHELFILLFNEDFSKAVNNYQSAASETLFPPGETIPFDSRMKQRIRTEFNQSKQVHLNNSNAANEEKEFLQIWQIKQLVLVPMQENGRAFGALCFACKNEPGLLFESVILPMLPLVTELFSNLIQRKRIEETLEVNEERYELALQGSRDGIWDWDIKNQTMYLSPRTKQILDINESKELLQEAYWESVLGPEEFISMKAHLTAHLNRSIPNIDIECRFKTDRTVDPIWFHLRGLANFDLLNQPVRMAGTITDISIRKRHEEQLLDDALHDPLTGLFNRTFFLQELTKLIHAAKRYTHPLCAAIINLRGFAALNDEYGHRAADEVLVRIAAVIRDILRSSDIAARSHADTFYILFPHTEAASAVLSLSRMQSSIFEADYIYEDRSIRASCSFAISDLTDKDHPECNSKALLEKIDTYIQLSRKNPDSIVVNGLTHPA